MDVFPLVDEGLGNCAYIVDLGDGSALVVDPERDPRPYLDELDRRGSCRGSWSGPICTPISSPVAAN